MTLSDLAIGKMAIVDQISLGYHGQGLITRLEAMGLTPNKPIRVLRKAWLGGPLHIQVQGYFILKMRTSVDKV
jgi:ferrous iron transport protein A